MPPPKGGGSRGGSKQTLRMLYARARVRLRVRVCTSSACARGCVLSLALINRRSNAINEGDPSGRSSHPLPCLLHLARTLERALNVAIFFGSALAPWIQLSPISLSKDGSAVENGRTAVTKSSKASEAWTVAFG